MQFGNKPEVAHGSIFSSLSEDAIQCHELAPNHLNKLHPD
jgi:hypothetical protein